MFNSPQRGSLKPCYLKCFLACHIGAMYVLPLLALSCFLGECKVNIPQDEVKQVKYDFCTNEGVGFRGFLVISSLLLQLVQSKVALRSG
jgi:hypothetical protein